MTRSPPRGRELPPGSDLALNRLQGELEALYRLEPGPHVADFVCVAPAGDREQVLVRESEGELRLSVELPMASLRSLLSRPGGLDGYAEAVEAVSHFVHLCDRARTRLQTTLLELELQAEVDKFLFIAAPPPRRLPKSSSIERHVLKNAHHRLYERVRFLHPSTCELGARYRLANHLAARLWSRLISRQGRPKAVEPLLRQFYRAGQAEKIRIALAA